MFRKGSERIELMLDVRNIIQTQKLVENISKVLFNSSQDRHLLYIQRRTELLDSEDDAMEDKLDLSVNQMMGILKAGESNKAKLTAQEVEYTQRLHRGLYVDRSAKHVSSLIKRLNDSDLEDNSYNGSEDHGSRRGSS